MVAQFIGVGQIAVVGNTDTIGRVNIKRLRQSWTRAAGRRITNMADANVTHQSCHMLIEEDISRQADAFANMKFTIVVGDNTSGILTAMLQDSQRIIEPYINI
jgi:hypothetical protein